MKYILWFIIAIFTGIGMAALLIYIVEPGRDTKCSPRVTDIIYNPRDSSWHLDVVTGKDTVEVPVDADTAAKFIHNQKQ